MALKKVIHLNKEFYGKKLNIPGAGVTEIPKDGVLELEENVAATLVKNSPDWKYEEEDSSEGDSGNNTMTELQQMLLAIDDMSIDEVKNICEESKIKGWKMFQNNEEALRQFVKTNLKKQSTTK